MRLIALSLSVALVGCAAESSWKFHDAHGWPQPSWSHSQLEGWRADTCGIGHGGVVVAPDAYSARQAVAISQCGVVYPGMRERVAVSYTAAAMHHTR